MESKADNPDDFQAAFAYITQLSRLIGEALGAESLGEIQITGSDYKAGCAVRDNETVAILSSAKTNLPNLLKKLA